MNHLAHDTRLEELVVDATKTEPAGCRGGACGKTDCPCRGGSGVCGCETDTDALD